MEVSRGLTSIFGSKKWQAILLFLVFSMFYIFLAWVVSGGDTWWIIDIINGTNVFYGDDAYRFFLARSAWLDPSLYSYNFVLPGALILDGLIISLSGADLFFSRSMHAVLGGGALCFLWGAGRSLGINRTIMTAAILVMGLIPRFVFTTLSFYGESWATFFICFALWAFTRNHYYLLALAAGLLPLIRPEGIFFLGFIWLYMIKEMRWKEAAIIIAPGVFYCIFLIVQLPAFSDYSLWRTELTKILEKIPFNLSKWEILETYTWLILIPSIFGLLYRPVWRIWPFLLAGLAWMLSLQLTVMFDLAKFEERYTLVLLPVLIILWASFLAWACSKIDNFIPANYVKLIIIGVFTAFVVLDGFRQLNQIDNKIQEKGFYWVAGRIIDAKWEEIFIHHSRDALAARESMSETIETTLNMDYGIDKLVIQDPFLYYNIDPNNIPSHVTVGYPATTYMVFHLLLNGQVFIQHSRNKMYSYLRFGEPDFRDGEKRALYVDLMPINNYPFTWKYNGLLYELYLFSYIESYEPENDIRLIPPLTQRKINNAWRDWMLEYNKSSN